MKIRYLTEYEEILGEFDSDSFARIGESVFINNEDWYVINIRWHPSIYLVEIYLAEEPPKQQKVAENITNAVESQNANKALSSTKQALKETKVLRRELFSIRQHLRTKK